MASNPKSIRDQFQSWRDQAPMAPDQSAYANTQMHRHISDVYESFSPPGNLGLDVESMPMLAGSASAEERILQYARNTMRRAGHLTMTPAELAAALHRAGASFDLIHETAAWLAELNPDFDRMEFLAAVDWDKPVKPDAGEEGER